MELKYSMAVQLALGQNLIACLMNCRQQVAADNEKLRQLQEAEAACEAEAVAAARAVEYRNELRHRLDIQVMLIILILIQHS